MEGIKRAYGSENHEGFGQRGVVLRVAECALFFLQCLLSMNYLDIIRVVDSVIQVADKSRGEKTQLLSVKGKSWAVEAKETAFSRLNHVLE